MEVIINKEMTVTNFQFDEIKFNKDTIIFIIQHSFHNTETLANHIL